MRRSEGEWKFGQQERTHLKRRIFSGVCVYVCVHMRACVHVFDWTIYDPKSRLNKNKNPGDTLNMEKKRQLGASTDAPK